MNAFTNICTLVGFLTIIAGVYALGWWIGASFGGWALAGYILAIFIGITTAGDIYWVRREREMLRRLGKDRYGRDI